VVGLQIAACVFRLVYVVGFGLGLAGTMAGWGW